MLALAAYAAFDPAAAGFFPRCPIRALTGLLCPGCGAQRALHALLHGDVAGAFSHNVLLPVALVLTAVATARPPRRPAGGYLRARWVWGLVALVVAYTVLRNAPPGVFT